MHDDTVNNTSDEDDDDDDDVISKFIRAMKQQQSIQAFASIFFTSNEKLK